jgi:hypothetical protein
LDPLSPERGWAFIKEITVDNRFFKIVDGPVWDQFIADRKLRIAAEKTIKQFMKSIGADNAYGSGPTSYCFTFPRSTKVDLTMWTPNKRIKGAYYPAKRGKAAAELRASFAELPVYVDINRCLTTVDLHPGFPSLIEASRGYSPHLRFYSIDEHLIIIQVPWKEVSKAEMDKYIAAHEKGLHSSAMYDYLRWTPHESMIEIKEWEALKIIDELMSKEK